MGWGMCICYFELARSLSQRKLGLILLGGLFYSVGAVLNLARWPILAPGLFGAHELFHLFVMAGTLTHFLFMVRVVLPYERPLAVEAVETLDLYPPSSQLEPGTVKG